MFPSNIPSFFSSEFYGCWQEYPRFQKALFLYYYALIIGLGEAVISKRYSIGNGAKSQDYGECYINPDSFPFSAIHLPISTALLPRHDASFFHQLPLSHLALLLFLLRLHNAIWSLEPLFGRNTKKFFQRNAMRTKQEFLFYWKLL